MNSEAVQNVSYHWRLQDGLVPMPVAFRGINGDTLQLDMSMELSSLAVKSDVLV